MMAKLLQRPEFEQLVTAVIGVNSVLLLWELFEDNEITERIESACLLFFVAELVVRWRRHRWNLIAFGRNPWNAFDVVVIGLSLLPLLGVDASLLRLARLSRTLHWLRHISHLRLVPLLWSVLASHPKAQVRLVAASPGRLAGNRPRIPVASGR